MAINIQRYIDIVSGVGGAAGVTARELIGRLFTSNALVPTDSLVDFESATEVSDYFGSSAEETLRANFYFGFISKSTVQAKKITFARWTDVDVAALIFGAAQTLTLTEWQAITDGSFGLELGPETNQVSGLNFSGASSFADVATILQVAIRAATTQTFWDTSTVTFNAVKNSYDFSSVVTGVAPISVQAGSTGTNIATSMGWTSLTTILSAGRLAEEPVDAVTASSDFSNNFGSFLFLDTLTLPRITALSQFTNAQNVVYQYCVAVLRVDGATFAGDLNGFSGVGLTDSDLGSATEFPEMTHMILLAATDYDRVNSTQNYMFQQFTGLTATVTDDATANALDALRINYYGQTQQAGRKLEFYQRGFLQGLSTAPVNMNVFANEQWLKDAALTALMNLLLALPKISANDTGKNQIAGTIQGVIDQATLNGTISAGKELTDLQKAFITTVTGDDKAFQQVQTLGYYVSVSIEEVPASLPIEFRGVYLLVYAKDDVVRSIDGTHTLI